MIHHISYEVNKDNIVRELEFWSHFGWNPTGLRRRSRKQPPIHWLINGDEEFAIELIPAPSEQLVATQGLGHIALKLGQRRYEIARSSAERFRVTVEDHPTWGSHSFFKSPQGYIVEAAEALKAIKSGPPLEEK